MAEIIELNRRIVMACIYCGGQEWRVVVDKPDFTKYLDLNVQNANK